MQLLFVHSNFKTPVKRVDESANKNLDAVCVIYVTTCFMFDERAVCPASGRS
jgi:hypothetical protein